MKKFFEVQAMCGHVGKGCYIPIRFAVVAESGKDAAARVRNYARVKHHHKKAILQVQEISLDEYLLLKSENEADPYLHCKNIQEQRGNEEINLRICPLPETDFWKTRKNKSLSVEYRQKKNRQRVISQQRILREYFADAARVS